MIQIGLGTQVRGAIDVALDDGVARAGALASVGWLDHLHRYAAFVVLAGATGLVFWLRTNIPAAATVVQWSLAVVLLAMFQIAFGIVLAYLFLSPVAQVLHLTVASLLLGAQTVLLLLLRGTPT
jgi:cytochrome c oxidase assembly protein subunit 15